MLATRTRTTLLAALGAVVVGCGSGDASDETAAPSRETALSFAHRPAPCERIFTPDAELFHEVVDATERWSKATGCNIHVGEGGIPVRLVEVVVGANGKQYPYSGGTYIGPNGPVVQVTAAREPHDIPHELGHALFPSARPGYPLGHVPPDADGQCRALMCGNGGDGHIIEEDLANICEGLPCSAFVAE